MSINLRRSTQLSNRQVTLRTRLTPSEVLKQPTSSACETADFTVFHQSWRKSSALGQHSTAFALILENLLKKKYHSSELNKAELASHRHPEGTVSCL